MASGDGVVVHPRDDEVRGVLPEQFEPAVEIDVPGGSIGIDTAVRKGAEEKLEVIADGGCPGESGSSRADFGGEGLNRGGDLAEDRLGGIVRGKVLFLKDRAEVFGKHGGEFLLAKAGRPALRPADNVGESGELVGALPGIREGVGEPVGQGLGLKFVEVLKKASDGERGI